MCMLSMWINRFVCFYSRLNFIFLFTSVEPGNTDPKSMFVYPRLCIVQKHDHRHAAFYPPLSRGRHKEEDFSREIIREFVEDFLADPDKMLEDTEHF